MVQLKISTQIVNAYASAITHSTDIHSIIYGAVTSTTETDVTTTTEFNTIKVIGVNDDLPNIVYNCYWLFCCSMQVVKK